MLLALENFIAASAAVLTAATMSGTGTYLHRRGFVSDEGTLFLARLTQQVTMPALLFSKIVYCKQDSSTKHCTSVIDMMDDLWMLLIWPIYVVCCGLIVGEIAAKLSNAPKYHKPLILASCAFPNNTGLPITLLTVIHQNYPPTTDLGRVDPTLYLSIYLLIYPMLQWGIGSWLLSSEEEQSDEIEDQSTLTHKSSQSDIDEEDFKAGINELTPLSSQYTKKCPDVQSRSFGTTGNYNVPRPLPSALNTASFGAKLFKVISVSFQPPVIASICGIIVTSIEPLRGVFVDMVNRDNDAPLEWFFDGIYSVGLSAVPLNMMILGINLSKTLQSNCDQSQLLSRNSTIAVILGKMVVMPMIGICSTFLLRKYFYDVSDGECRSALFLKLFEYNQPLTTCYVCIPNKASMIHFTWF
jgi:predicted permease